MPSVEHDIHINATKEAVWTVLADFGNVAKWSPALAASELTSTGEVGVGSTRACKATKFGSFTEEVLDWNSGESFTVELKGFGPMKFSRSTGTLHEHDGVSHLNASVTYQVKFGPMGALMSALFLKRSLSSALSGALQGLKYYVETSNEVGTKLPDEAKQAA